MSSGRMIIAAIGIDKYPNAGGRNLDNAVNDAKAVVDLLRQVGFDATLSPPLYNDAATYAAMWSMVTDGPLTQLEEEDNLVVFYAGHGTSRPKTVAGKQVPTGYLLPSDAIENKYGTWMQLEPWLKNIATLPPRHILVILDACQSGVALNPVVHWRDLETTPGQPLSSLVTRTSRRVITSALDDERAMDGGPVHGHSLFTGCLLEALRYGVGELDRKEVTGSELGIHLRNRVIAYPGAKQTPDYGAFEFDERGEIALPILEPGLKKGPRQPPLRPRKWSALVVIVTSALASAAVAAVVAFLVGRQHGSDLEEPSVKPADAFIAIDAAPDVALVSIDAALDFTAYVESVQAFTNRNGVSIQSGQILRSTYREYVRRLPEAERVAATPAVGWEEGDDAPVGGVTHTQAAAFCTSIKAKLPTEEQWTKAKPSGVLPREWSERTRGAFAKVMGEQPEWLPMKATPGIPTADDPAIVPQIGFRCAR